MLVEENRLSLMGDPIGHGPWGKALAFVQRKDVQATALGMAYVLGAAALCHPEGGAGLLFKELLPLGYLSVLLCATRAVDRWFLTAIGESRQTASRKRINKKPHRVDPQKAQEWQEKADLMRCLSGFSTGASFIAAGVVALPLLWLTDSASWGWTSAVPAGMMAARWSMTAYRWHKVAQGDWMVEDRTPLPVRKKEKARLKQLFWPLSPLPQAG